MKRILPALVLLGGVALLASTAKADHNYRPPTICYPPATAYRTPAYDPYSYRGYGPRSPYGVRSPYNTRRIDPYTARRIDPYTARRIDPYTARRIDPYTARRIDPYTGRRVDPYRYNRVSPYGLGRGGVNLYTPRAGFSIQF